MLFTAAAAVGLAAATSLLLGTGHAQQRRANTQASAPIITPPPPGPPNPAVKAKPKPPPSASRRPHPKLPVKHPAPASQDTSQLGFGEPTNPTSTSDCKHVDVTPTSAQAAMASAAAFCLVNAERAQNGLPPLHENAQLASSARAHSADMVARHYFDHTTPDGVGFQTRIFDAGYASSAGGYALAENIAWGPQGADTPSTIVGLWMQSPEHRANILNGEYRDAGMGVAAGAPSSDGGMPAGTYTQDFGAIL